MSRLTTRLLPLLAFEAILAALMFGTAGRLDLPWFWALLAVHATLLGGAACLVDGTLLRERVRPGAGARDRGFRSAITACLLAHLVVAGLDAGRFGWSPDVPTAARAAALAVYALGLAFSLWAILTNRFFSSVVRIQLDRGH